jgi:serine/threonine-protein kinase RsbW
VPAKLRYAHEASSTPELGDSGLSPNGAVDVVCPATAAQLPVLRAIATAIALRADADLDLVADLRLAVDEVCTTLIRSAGPEESLRCRFSSSEDSVRVEASVWSERREPADDELGRLLLASLADQVSTGARPLDDGFVLRTSVMVRVHPEASRVPSGASS